MRFGRSRQMQRRWRTATRLCATLGGAAALASLATAPALGQPRGLMCAISGSPVMKKDIAIYAEATGDAKVARFTGANSGMVAFNFPSKDGGRVEVKTGTGAGEFRIHGFIDAAELPLYAAQQVPVVADHIWVNKGAEVQLERVVGGRLKVKQVIAFPIKETYEAWGDCNAFALSSTQRTRWLVPDSADPVLIKKTEVKLYTGPGKKRQEVGTLHRAAWGDGLLVWRTQRTGEYAQIRYDGEVTIQAWIRQGDAEWFPKGEIQEPYSPASRVGHSRIRPAGKPKELTCGSAEITIFSAPRDGSGEIGVVEPETELLVVDVVGKWASVLPKNFNVAPHGEGQFWVPMKDLGITRKDLEDVRPPAAD